MVSYVRAILSSTESGGCVQIARSLPPRASHELRRTQAGVCACRGILLMVVVNSGSVWLGRAVRALRGSVIRIGSGAGHDCRIDRLRVLPRDAKLAAGAVFGDLDRAQDRASVPSPVEVG